MANNCYNYLEISGSKADIKRLEECIKSDKKDDSGWDMSKIIPVEIDEKGFYKIENSIYDIWGTKWFDGEYFENKGKTAVLTFDTAWSPSLPVTLEMSRKFNLKVKHFYEESGCDFEGDYNVDNGEVILDDQRPYTPDCHDCGEKFNRDDMIYNEEEGEYLCKRCGDELVGIMMDKLEMIKQKREK